MLTLVLMVVLVALVFEYINGFHDTANSIATVVATKVFSPMQAVALAASTNLVGALWGMNVGLPAAEASMAFWYLVGGAGVISVVLALLFWRRGWL